MVSCRFGIRLSQQSRIFTVAIFDEKITSMLNVRRLCAVSADIEIRLICLGRYALGADIQGHIAANVASIRPLRLRFEIRGGGNKLPGLCVLVSLCLRPMSCPRHDLPLLLLLLILLFLPRLLCLCVHRRWRRRPRMMMMIPSVAQFECTFKSSGSPRRECVCAAAAASIAAVCSGFSLVLGKGKNGRTSKCRQTSPSFRIMLLVHYFTNFNFTLL